MIVPIYWWWLWSIPTRKSLVRAFPWSEFHFRNGIHREEEPDDADEDGDGDVDYDDGDVDKDGVMSHFK